MTDRWLYIYHQDINLLRRHFPLTWVTKVDGKLRYYAEAYGGSNEAETSAEIDRLKRMGFHRVEVIKR